IAKSARIAGAIMVDICKLLLGLIVIFFFSLALGFYLGELLGSYALGFLATGGIFLVFLLLINIFSTKLEAKFMDLTIRKVLGRLNEEEADPEPISSEPIDE